MKVREIAKYDGSISYLDYVLRNRGIENPEEFLDIDFLEKCCHSPNLFIGIKEAMDMYVGHIAKDNEILFIVDSDNDGYTSSAILWNYTKRVFPHAKLNYVLHTSKQHGLEDTCDSILSGDTVPSLVVLPDAGSNDQEYHKILNDAKIDVLVLDHHQFNTDCREANKNTIIVNNQDGSYPNKTLSGAGVVLKFCEYLDKALGVDYTQYFYDLAAIGIIGDMMDLRDYETQYIVRRGLSDIHNPGLVELAKVRAYSIFGKSVIGAGELTMITPTDVSFFIVPLTNALIRVGRDQEKEILFLSLINGKEMVQSTKRGDKGQESIAAQNARNCTNAHSRQSKAKEKAMEELERQIIENDLLENKILFLTTEDMEIESSLTGLVAMQLLSKYRRPVIVAKKNKDGFYRGSSRGIDNSELSSLRDFLIDSEMFEYAEGHDNANGISIKSSKVEDFIEYSNNKLANIDFGDGIFNVDFNLRCDDSFLGKAIIELGRKVIKKLWGKGLEEPSFCVEFPNVSIDDFSFMKSNTIKLTSGDVSFIKFRGERLEEELRNAPKTFRLRLIGKASINEWAGSSYPQIIIDSYEIFDNSLEF